GYNRYRAYRLAHTFRKHTSRVDNELYKHHKEDEKLYLSEANKYALELKELFQAEKEDSDHMTDESWDISSRLEEAREINRPPQEE
ncbi:MAG: hypothetical protein U9R49_03770, partial [Bacteroidota bacterium]|nr:hypothetical protein [Bacteroidota bacterium]